MGPDALNELDCCISSFMGSQLTKQKRPVYKVHSGFSPLIPGRLVAIEGASKSAVRDEKSVPWLCTIMA